MQLGNQPVARDDGAVVGEPLVGVDHAGEVDPGIRILDQLRVGALRDDDGEGRRRHEVAVPQGLATASLPVIGLGLVLHIVAMVVRGQSIRRNLRR